MLSHTRLFVTLFLLTSPPAIPQAPAGAEHLSYPAVVDSLAVLKKLSDKVKQNYNDPESWYRQGMVAWSLYEACRHVPHYAILDCTRPRILADTALMIAGELKPDDDKFALALTRFLLASEGTFRRESPYLDRIFKSSVERMRRNADPIKHADAALDAGRLYWLRYDAEAHREWESATAKAVRDLAAKRVPDSLKDNMPGALTSETLRQSRNVLDGKLLTAARNDFWGSSDYARAESFFREAFEAAPDYARAYRQYATLLAERSRWSELRSAAVVRATKVATDGWAWMSIALADYRLGDKRNAALEFDSAQKLLPASDRKHVIAIQRLLQPIERIAFDKNPAGFSSTYWDRVAPLWSARTEDDPRLEFFARVAYAELVWTADELRQHGVDSDRGDAFVRFGPPDRIYSNRNDRAMGHLSGTIRWDYDYPPVNPPRSFVFNRIPKFKTSSYSDDTIPMLFQPSATWDNLIRGRIDSIPVQLARFRALPDSVDLYFATKPPVDAIRRATQITAPVRTDFWLQTSERAPVVHDSILGDSAGLRAFTRRVAPGAYYYRTEATGNAALVAGRASSNISASDGGTGFTVHGFGVSDLLLGTRADARLAAPLRWTDIDVAPLLGSIKRNAQLSLVWETYGLQKVDDQMRYGVTIVVRSGGVERPGAQGPPNVGVRIVGGTSNSREIKQTAVNNGVQFLFDRVLPYRDVAVDNITIALVNTKPGRYTVMVRITDRVTGKSVSGFRSITILQ
jgi:GWxTD domain-containing protein